MKQPGIVIAFVKVLKDTREDLRLFIWEVDAFGVRFEELATAAGSKERRQTEDILMSCK
jgi:hypothetical protein